MSKANEFASTSSSKTNSKDLPPSRKSKSIRPVSPPLSKIPFNKFIYTLTLILLLMGVFYSYRTLQHKRQVGGWWNLLLGKSPMPSIAVHNQGHGPAVGGEWVDDKHDKLCNPSDLTVEDRINALAQALGATSPDLARAIAGAVRHYSPPASLSSIAAKETGEAVRILTNEVQTDKEPGPNAGSGSSAHGPKEPSPGIFEGIIENVENFVGMDEP